MVLSLIRALFICSFNCLGRERRLQREIAKIELKKAIKHGKREPSDPGRNGERRWKFTYNGVVYITDDSLRHEITSWRIDDGRGIFEGYNHAADYELVDTHVVLVVDSSGSMRNADMEGTYLLTYLLSYLLAHLHTMTH
jgi:hypothetical protein